MIHLMTEKIVRDKLRTLLTDFLVYGTSGNDFTNDLQNELKLKVTELDDRSFELNDELFEKFIDNVTTHVCSGIITGLPTETN
jgi:hypothetical protein